MELLIIDEKQTKEMMKLLRMNGKEKERRKLTILLSSSSYARQGNTAVRIPEVCGSIAGPARFTNSLRYLLQDQQGSQIP